MRARRAVAAAGFAGALVAAARPVQAGTCGGSGGGAGGGSGNGSSSNGSSSSHSGPIEVDERMKTQVCVETSDVVGRQRCTHYGEWSLRGRLPRVAVEIGSSMHAFRLSGLHFAGDVQHSGGGRFPYQVDGRDLGGRAVAIGFDFRLLAGVGRHLYGGGELSLGGVAGDDTMSTTLAAGPDMSTEPVTHILAGGVVGVRAPLGAFTVGAELLGGTRTLAVETQSRFHLCETRDVAYDTEAVVQPRVRAEAWLGPWLSLGGFAGGDLLGRGERAAGLFVSLHARAFDGSR